MKLIERMNQTNYGATQKRTRQEFAQDLLTSQEFDALIIRDLDAYITYANTRVQKGDLTADNRGTLELSDDHPFSHIRNIKSRLKRLRSLLNFAKGKFQPA